MLGARLLIQPPQKPEVGRHGHIADVVAQLRPRGRVAEIACDHLLRLLGRVVRAGDKCADVAARVGHAGIFPVDQVHLPLLVDQKVWVIAVAVAGAQGDRVALQALVQRAHRLVQLLHAGKVGDVRPLQPVEKAVDLLPDVKPAVELYAARVQAAQHTQRRVDLLGVVIVQNGRVLDIVRDLPALGRVDVEKRVVEPQRLGRLHRPRLGRAVDVSLRARTGVAVHVVPAVARELERQVRQPRLDRDDAVDAVWRAVEHGADVIENVRVGIGDIGAVKRPQLIERVKLMDAAGIFADVHLQLADVPGVQILPEPRPCDRAVILPLEDLRELLTEAAVEIGVSDHVPRVAPADLHARDAALAVRDHAVLVRFARTVERRVIRLIHIGLKRVLLKVVVRGADEGVFQPVADEHERGGVVVAVVILVDDDLHMEAVLEVKQLFLHIADHDRDVVDARRLQLADLTLDEHLALHLQQGLRLFIRQGGKARAHARRHNDGVVHPVRRERRKPRIRDAVCPVETAHGAQLLDHPVHGAERFAGALRDGALRKRRLARGTGGNVAEQRKLIFCQQDRQTPLRSFS